MALHVDEDARRPDYTHSSRVNIVVTMENEIKTGIHSAMLMPLEERTT